MIATSTANFTSCASPRDRRHTPPTYLIVPKKPITFLDHAGTPHTVHGVEAGIVWMALAWLTTIDSYGKTGMFLDMLYGLSLVQNYVASLASKLALAARQFPAGVRILD